MIQLPKDFKELLALLNEKKVEYLVVGGYAVAIYGYPRATGDLDIWIAISDETSKKMVELLKEFGFSVENLESSIFLEKERIIRMGNPPLRIEVMTSIDGVNFNDCFNNKKVLNIDGIEVNFLSLDDLKKNKEASGRHKDLDDLEHLEQI